MLQPLVSEQPSACPRGEESHRRLRLPSKLEVPSSPGSHRRGDTYIFMFGSLGSRPCEMEACMPCPLPAPIALRTKLMGVQEARGQEGGGGILAGGGGELELGSREVPAAPAGTCAQPCVYTRVCSKSLLGSVICIFAQRECFPGRRRVEKGPNSSGPLCLFLRRHAVVQAQAPTAPPGTRGGRAPAAPGNDGSAGNCASGGRTFLSSRADY